MTAHDGGTSCTGSCAACGGLADRVSGLKKKLAKLEARGTVQRLGIRAVEARVGMDASTIGRHIKAGTFPAPVYLAGSSLRRWDLATLESWEAQQIATPHVPRVRGIAAAKAAARRKAARHA